MVKKQDKSLLKRVPFYDKINKALEKQEKYFTASNLKNNINLYQLCYEIFISFEILLFEPIQLANEITFLH